MPQRRNAIKALRINKQRSLRNLRIKTDIKKAIKNFKAVLAQKNQAEAQKLLNVLYQKFDKAVKSNLYHKNTVARRKSRFSRLLSPKTAAKKS